MSRSIPEHILAHVTLGANDPMDSGATSPGAGWGEEDADQQEARYRPRTYPYHQYLPYDVEDESERQAHLDQIVKNLYISIQSGDFAPGTIRWSRELRNWLDLKFDLPRATRTKLVKLYYELSMAPGLDPAIFERFATMFMVLTKYYPKPVFHDVPLL